MLERILKILILLTLPFLGYGFVRVWMGMLSGYPWNEALAKAFLWGAGISSLAWLVMQRQLTFFATLEHELTHMFVGLLFFKRPSTLHVSEEGNGAVTMYGDNFLISLAPYFLPTFCLFLLPFPLFLQPEALPWFNGILGAATAFHFWTGIKETHLQQPDLRNTGLWFALPFILVANIVTYGTILAFVRDGYPGLQAFLAGGLQVGVRGAGLVFPGMN